MNGIELHNGDCLELMKDIPDKSIDMILCDLPYGVTACKWDSVIPFAPLWEQYDRIIKDNGAIVLFGTQPFTSRLICSNLKEFKYTWVWDKCKVGGFTNAKHRPLKIYEDICVFSKGDAASRCKNRMVYYPQGLKEVNTLSRSSKDQSAVGYARPSQKPVYLQRYTNYPNQYLKFKLDRKRFHETQKPVALLEYLIRTYTREGETVLDNCMGSGSTGVAALNTGRKFVGIELNRAYFEVAEQRILRNFEKTI